MCPSLNRLYGVRLNPEDRVVARPPRRTKTSFHHLCTHQQAQVRRAAESNHNFASAGFIDDVSTGREEHLLLVDDETASDDLASRIQACSNRHNASLPRGQSIAAVSRHLGEPQRSKCNHLTKFVVRSTPSCARRVSRPCRRGCHSRRVRAALAAFATPDAPDGGTPERRESNATGCSYDRNDIRGRRFWWC